MASRNQRVWKTRDDAVRFIKTEGYHYLIGHRVMRAVPFGDRWAVKIVHPDGRSYWIEKE